MQSLLYPHAQSNVQARARPPFTPTGIDMKKITLASCLAASLGATLGTAHAQTYEVVQPIETRPLRFVFGTGVTFGGDKMATAVYDDGDEVDIRAGGTLALQAGLDYRFAAPFSVQATVGYHIDSATAWNGDLRFERVPVELLGYFHINDRVRAGGGVRYVTNASLRSDGGSRHGFDDEFEDTTSAVAELEYMHSGTVGFKLRYVNDEFKEKTRGYRVKGDHVGLLANFYF
jgi:hypothetical protein